MKQLKTMFCGLTLLALIGGGALIADAQGGGGGKGRQPTGGQPGTIQRGQTSGQRGQGGGVRDQQRIQATDQQRDQLRTCADSADRVRQQAREMVRAAGKASYTADQARQQRDQLRERIQIMQQEHNRFTQGLNQEQRTQLQERLRAMEQQRDRVQRQLQAMDQELGQAVFNRERLRRQAREMERALNEWQKQYRVTGNALSNVPLS